MRKGFTLIELLVVVGIMGMLGVAASGGYSALTRGMRNRGVCAAASGILRAAQERANVDRKRTVVYCYNVCLKAPRGNDESGVVVGRMTAVRQSGRITYKRGSFLYDEFADLNLSYEVVSDESELERYRGHRLFKYNGGPSSRMEYSIVSDAVFEDSAANRVTLFSGGGVNGETNLSASAFYDLGTSERNPSGGWKVGDGYALEFAELELAQGYVFGQQVPTTEGAIVDIKAIVFEPDGSGGETVDIYSTKPNSAGNPQPFEPAGKAKSDESQSV